ncbi:MAG TPA: hypothetical protein VFA92_13355 [Candidatus Binatia bacterium]|nr:hypothetical protein [Candidatus Binatia bacterium]
MPNEVQGWPDRRTASPRSQASRVALPMSTRWPSASAIEVSASSAWTMGPSTPASTSAARSHHCTRNTRRPVSS